jgi:hypothetical protein
MTPLTAVWPLYWVRSPSYIPNLSVNSYIPSIFMMPAAVHTVIKDLGTWDAPRPVFLTGA